MCHNCTTVSCVIDSNGAEQPWCVCNNLTGVRFTSMLMSYCVGGLAWLMAHIANRAVWEWGGEQRSKGEIKRLYGSCEGIRQSERRVAGDCVVSLWGKGKYSWGLIPLAEKFTKAKEQGRGKKIAFENAAVNLRKDIQHLLQHSLHRCFVWKEGKSYVPVEHFVFCGCLIHGLVI